MTKYTVVERTGKKSFEIKLGKRTYYLFADEEIVCDLWIHDLEFVLKRL